MDEIETILNQLRARCLADRLRIAHALIDEAQQEQAHDESAIARRGLASLTESTLLEDWSEHYPANLKQRKVG